MTNDAMRAQMATGKGFIAALDQSGGSTPKALRLYGIEEDAYSSEDEMFDLIHDMRTRIATAPAFTGDKVIGAILFEMTMDREIGGKPSAKYLWEERRVVPFLKIDKGLEAEENDVQLMKPIPGLSDLLDRAVAHGIFGTKERSVISAGERGGDRGHRRPAVRTGGRGSCEGPRADPRAGSHDLDPRQGGGRGHAAGLDPEASRHAGPAGHAETQPAHQGQSLCAPDRASQGAAGRRAVGWLCPRRGERETGREPRHDRELQAAHLPRGCRRSSRTEAFNATIAATIGGIYAASIT